MMRASRAAEVARPRRGGGAIWLANQACSSGMPAAGDRVSAASVRAARVSARAPAARAGGRGPGSRSGAGWRPGRTRAASRTVHWSASGASPAPPSAIRSPPDARSGRPDEGAHPGAALHESEGGQLRIAFCTVTGLAPYSATSARLDGSRAPGGAEAIQERRPRRSDSALSLVMTAQSSATPPRPPVLSSPHELDRAWAGGWSASPPSRSRCHSPASPPMTGLSALFIGSGRAVVAATVLAVVALTVTRQRCRPGCSGRGWRSWPAGSSSGSRC